MRHIAREGRMYVVAVCSFLRGCDVPADMQDRDTLYGGAEDTMARGGTVIVDPYGDVLAGPLFDAEGILYTEIDLDVVRAARRQFDPVGHYARHDVFRLTVDTGTRPAARFADMETISSA
jgi:nitrilase